MNILITGASGFIGQHLVKLLSTEHHVFGVIRRGRSLEQHATPVIADLTDQEWTRYLPGDIDCIVHLAQSSKYRDFPDGVLDMRMVNIDATVTLLEWARKTGVKQFVFSSTANVYAPSASSLLETSSAIPGSFYGATKLAAEHLARQYQKYFQVDILRLFTVFGTGQTGMLISNVIERIRSGQEITLAKGEGIYLSPVYVGDVVNVIKRLLSIPAERDSRLMNVCGNHAASLSEILRIMELLLKRSAITHITDEEVAFFIGNNNKLRKLMADYQFLDLESGLELTICPKATIQ